MYCIHIPVITCSIVNSTKHAKLKWLVPPTIQVLQLRQLCSFHYFDIDATSKLDSKKIMDTIILENLDFKLSPDYISWYYRCVVTSEQGRRSCDGRIVRAVCLRWYGRPTMHYHKEAGEWRRPVVTTEDACLRVDDEMCVQRCRV